MENFSNEETDQEQANILRLAAPTTPQESLKTIERAERYNMHPDHYNQSKEMLDPEAELQERIPAEVDQGVKNFSKRSSLHASAIKDEVGTFDKAAKIFGHVKFNLIEKQESENEIYELQNKAFEGKIEPHEREMLDFLEKEHSKKIKSFELSENEQMLGNAAGVVNDMGRTIGNNKALIATGAGIGALSLTPVGVAAGVGGAFSIAMAKDTFNRITVGTFSEIDKMKGDDGKPLEMSFMTKKNISRTVGVLSAVVEGGASFLLAKGVGKLSGKFISKGIEEIIKNPAKRATIQVLSQTLETAFTGGGEEAASELAAVFGENWAKAEGSGAGLWNALERTAQDLQKSETWKRIGRAGATGAIASGGITGTVGTLAAPKMVKSIEKYNANIEKAEAKTKVIDEARKVLQAQNDFLKFSDTIKNTDLKNKSPEQMKQLKKDIIKESGFEGKITFTEADINTIAAANPELAQKIRDLDVTESNTESIGAGSIIEPHEFLDLVDEAPDVADYARLNPEAPNPLESKNLLLSLDEARKKRQKMFEDLNVEAESDLTDDEKRVLKKKLDGEKLDLSEELVLQTANGKKSKKYTPEVIKSFEDVDNIEDELVKHKGAKAYIEETKTFSDNIKEVVSEKEAARYNEVQKQVREQVVEQMAEEFFVQEQKTEDKVVRFNDKVEAERLEKKHKKDFETVEKFKVAKAGKGKASHKTAGFPAMAIDPNSIPSYITTDYLNDKSLTKRKAFVEGGISLEKAAKLMGFDSPEGLLIALRDSSNDSKLVQNFRKSKAIKGKKSHKLTGFSPLAIDPNSLPPDVRETYINDPKLKKYKVFVEGGIDLEVAAGLAGFKSGAELINTLANAPTKEELLQIRKDKSNNLRRKVRKSREKTRVDRLETVFDDFTKLHQAEMKIMRETQWPTSKQGFKRIALPAPNIEEIQGHAKRILAKTKVSNVSPKQFNVAEKGWQRKAFDHITKNEVEDAYVAKEKAILNVELTRESLKAKRAITEGRAVVERITSKKGQANLKASGLDVYANEIINLFNLNKSSDKQGKNQESYFAHIERKRQEGESVIVPEELSDIRQRGEDLTVEQYVRLVDRLKNIEHQSKYKNKLLKRRDKKEKAKKLNTIEAKVADAVEGLKEHPAFDEKRINKQATRTFKEKALAKFTEGFEFLESYQTNFKNIIIELDQELLAGINYDTLAQGLVDSETFKRGRNLQVTNQVKKIAKDYGEKEFHKAFNDFIDIKELSDFSDLQFGRIARSDLWRLFSYLGDPSGRQRIENFKNKAGESLTAKDLTTILEKYLDHKDAKVAQNLTNIFKSFEKEAFDLHLKHTGVEPTMVKAVPIHFKGKVYDGGYVPLDYKNVSNEEMLSRYIDALGEKSASAFGNGNKEDGKLYSLLATAGMTDQGRLVDRTGSKNPLDFDFFGFLNGYEEHVHDIAYRESGIDTLKLLNNEGYKNAIIATVGQAKYDLLGKSVIETVGRPRGNELLDPLAKEAKGFERFQKFVESGFSVAVLGAKASSVAMQPLSLGGAKLRMGPKGGRYLAKGLANAASRGFDYHKLYDEASKLNPDLITQRDGIDDTVIKSNYHLPKTVDIGDYSQEYATIRQAKQELIEASMYGLNTVDLHIKAIVTMSAYAQFKAGDVPNYPMSRLAKMTPEQQFKAAQNYCKQVADAALTTSATIDKSAAEKIVGLNMFAKFYTDVRSQANTGFSEVRKIRNEIIKGKKKKEKGESNASNMKAAAALGSNLALVYVMTKMYADIVHREENPLEDLLKVNSMGDVAKWVGNTAAYSVKATAQVPIGNTLIAKDAMFLMEGYGGRRDMSVPFLAGISSIPMSMMALAESLHKGRLTQKQLKTILTAASVGTKGIPVNGVFEAYNMISDSDILGNIAGFTAGQVARLGKEISLYIKEHGNDESKQEYIKELKQIQKEFIPGESQETDNVIPENIKETLKTSKWDEVNPDTGAAGVYQFTEERWDEIAEAAPDLGLTDDGRVSKDTTEQEKALDYSLEKNAENLINLNLEVNDKNLYGAHRFGMDDYAAVLFADDNEKIANIVENKALFKGFTTVKEIKRYVAKQVK